MSSSRDFVDDLVVLGRRGDRPQAEQRSLREVLSASPDLRLLFDAGRAFDDEAAILPGDDARIERIARKVAGRRAGPSRPSSRTMALAAMVGALGGGIAVGAMQIRESARSGAAPAAVAPAPFAYERPAEAPEGLPPVAGTGAGGASDAPAVAATTSAASSNDIGPEPESEPKSLRGKTRARIETTPSVATAPPRPLETPHASSTPPPAEPGSANVHDAPTAPASEAGTPAGLFASANRLRIGGDTARAIAAYERLQATFPSSAEAMTANLSLGMLYLQQNRNDRALQAFERSAAGGSASPEALWGEAQALDRLGRTEEERGVLDRLVRNYPGSVYVGAARKRLVDLR